MLLTSTVPVESTSIQPAAAVSEAQIELSVVMPCLNEADTLASCINKALRALQKEQISGEVIVADNGSTDGSQEIARQLGARVVNVAHRGYGNALMGGIAASHGKYVLMGDADDSYDFGELGKFVARLREGHALVQGCRLPSGGGTVMPGAMPFLHRWWGNPMFSQIARLWFNAPIHDTYCGLRAFTRVHYESLEQCCTGMEFAIEMIIKSSLRGADIVEVPITLHKDGRVSHPPHLRTFRDGWRTLRFFLLFSPRWLFLIPGLIMILAGIVGYAISMPSMTIGHVNFDLHTLLCASVAILCGYQCIVFAIFTKQFAIAEKLLPKDDRLEGFFKVVNLERGLLLGFISLLGGVGAIFFAFLHWRSVGFGNLNYPQTMRWVIPGAMFTALGFQTILSSFFSSILGMHRK